MRRVMYATVVHLVCAATVVAQSYTEAPPKEGLEQKGSAFEWLLVAAFLVGTLVVAFKPAKRVNLR